MSIKITTLETKNQNHENVTLFDPWLDALAFKMFVTASSGFLALERPTIAYIFEIIDPITNQVVRSESVQWDPADWISVGNNWGPTPNDFTTASKWGLDWTGERGVYGFRGIIKGYFWAGENGLQTEDAFDVSDTRWFRLKEVGRL